MCTTETRDNNCNVGWPYETNTYKKFPATGAKNVVIGGRNPSITKSSQSVMPSCSKQLPKLSIVNQKREQVPFTLLGISH